MGVTYFPVVEEVDLGCMRKEFHGETEELRCEFHEMMLELPRLIVMTVQHKLQGWVLDGGGCPDHIPPAQETPGQVPPEQPLVKHPDVAVA
ncbi:UNVERIFIED_CONTAM: hypothetical protein K2H54_025730 [Gekko kuhli]